MIAAQQGTTLYCRHNDALVRCCTCHQCTVMTRAAIVLEPSSVISVRSRLEDSEVYAP